MTTQPADDIHSADTIDRPRKDISSREAGLRPVQLHDRNLVDDMGAAEFTIQSGAFGGEWSSTRGDLETEYFEPTQLGA